MTLARSNIVLLYRDGVSQTEIARQAGVSRQRINQVVTSFKDEVLRLRYLESLRISNDLVARVRSDREARRRAQEVRQRDREFRMAYLEAHPRAKRALTRSREAPQPSLATSAAGGGASAPAPILRVVR